MRIRPDLAKGDKVKQIEKMIQIQKSSAAGTYSTGITSPQSQTGITNYLHKRAMSSVGNSKNLVTQQVKEMVGKSHNSNSLEKYKISTQNKILRQSLGFPKGMGDENHSTFSNSKL